MYIFSAGRYGSSDILDDAYISMLLTTSMLVSVIGKAFVDLRDVVLPYSCSL